MRVARGLPLLEDVCHKHAGHLAYRLRAEYFPGPPPFPGSPEEEAWLLQRETLVLTVVGRESGWRVASEWTVGGKAQPVAGERELPAAELASLPDEVEAAGGWELPSLPATAAGPGTIRVEHEAYAYQDAEPDSLDLEAWAPPRRFRVAAATAPGRHGERERRLIAAYAGLVPAELRERSALAPLFPR